MKSVFAKLRVQFAGLTFNWETQCMTWLMRRNRHPYRIPGHTQSETYSDWLAECAGDGRHRPEYADRRNNGKTGSFPAPFIISLFVPAGFQLAGTYPDAVIADE